VNKEMTIYLMYSDRPGIVERFDRVISIEVDRETKTVLLVSKEEKNKFLIESALLHNVISFESN
jgi:hypothetical protein